MKNLLLATLLSAPLLSQAGPVNLVRNGSFEVNAVAAASHKVLFSDQLSSWQLGSNGVELRNNLAGKAYDGNNYVELDAYQNSSISQMLNTVRGQWYELSFAYSNRSGLSVDSNGLGWSIGDLSSTAPVLAYNNTGGNVWTKFSVRYQATGSNSLLSFAALGTSDCLGTSLDGVSVTNVPEPESLSLAGLALLGLGFARRKRQANSR